MCETEYVALATGLLVFISEALPFIESHKSNGILHFVYVCLYSDCHKKNILKEEANDEEPKETAQTEMVEVNLESDGEDFFDDDEDDY